MGQHRRDFVVRYVVLLSLLGSAACSTGTKASAKPTPAADTKLLTVGAPVDTFTVDPSYKANVSIFGANASIIEGLSIAGPDLSLRPLLATSWTFQPPGTWQIELRQGVTFQNGAPFNSDAVAATLNGRVAQAHSVLGVTATSTKVTGPFSVEVTTNPPNSRLMYQLAHPSNGIVAPGTYPGVGSSPENTPTGTGPYRFENYTPKSELRVRRNDTYWGPRPAYDEMLFRFTPDGTSRVLALKAGDVNAIYDVPRQQVANLEKEHAFQVVKSAVGALQFLTLNMNGTPPYDLLNDIEVRKAISQAIDTGAIVNNVWPDGAVVNHTMVPPALLGSYASTVTGYAYNPAAARAELDRDGWTVGSDGVRTKAGRRLVLTMQVYLPDEQQPLPELVKAELGQIGIAVNINVPPDTTTYFAMAAHGQGDIFSDNAATGVEHPLGPAVFYATGGSRGFLSPGPAYDQLYQQALGAATNDEFQRTSAQMMHILVDEDALIVPIAGVFRIYGLSSKLDGLVPYTFIYSQRWATVKPRT